MSSSDENVTYREYFLGVDEFNHPKVYKNEDATYVLLIRLILLEKGTYPTRPDMGVGLVSRYRYAFNDKIKQLESDITDQIATYLPEFTGVSVKVESDNKIIVIAITIDKYTYQLTYTRDKNTLSAL